MSEQIKLFVKNNYGSVNVKPETPHESTTQPTTVKFNAKTKKIITEFCYEKDVSVSAFLRDAACLYHDFFPLIEKLAKYQDAVKELLIKLP